MQNAIPVIFVREHMSSHHIYLALSLEFVCLFVCVVIRRQSGKPCGLRIERFEPWLNPRVKFSDKTC